MTLSQFRRFFEKDIHVIFAWENLLNSDCDVIISRVELPSMSDEIFLPWYVDSDGRACSHDKSGAKPLTLKAASENSEICKLNNVKPYQGESNPILPAYKIGNGISLLLDGCHRACGIMLRKIPATIEMAELNGEISQSICPDLKHWA